MNYSLTLDGRLPKVMTVADMHVGDIAMLAGNGGSWADCDNHWVIMVYHKKLVSLTDPMKTWSMNDTVATFKIRMLKPGEVITLTGK